MIISKYKYVPVKVSRLDVQREGMEALFCSEVGGALSGPFPWEWNEMSVRLDYVGRQVVVTGQLVLQHFLNEQWAFLRVASVSFGAYHVEVVLGPYSVEGPPFDAAHLYLWRLYSPEGELLPHLGFRLPDGIQSGIDQYLTVLGKALEPIVMGTGAFGDLWDVIKPG